MGRQVGFYAIEADSRAMLELTRDTGDIAYLRTYSYEPSLASFRIKEDPLSYGKKRGSYLIWNQAWPISEESIYGREEVVWDWETVTKHHTGQIIYHLPVSYDLPVIEYGASRLIDSYLTPGRIWAAMCRSVDGKLVHKGEAFQKWYERIARWIRRHFVKIDGIDEYLGPETEKWVRAGGWLRHYHDRPNFKLPD